MTIKEGYVLGMLWSNFRGKGKVSSVEKKLAKVLKVSQS